MPSTVMLHVRFGSQAAGQHHIRRTAGFERLPAVQTESRSKVSFERPLSSIAVVQMPRKPLK